MKMGGDYNTDLTLEILQRVSYPRPNMPIDKTHRVKDFLNEALAI